MTLERGGGRSGTGVFFVLSLLCWFTSERYLYGIYKKRESETHTHTHTHRENMREIVCKGKRDCAGVGVCAYVCLGSNDHILGSPPENQICVYADLIKIIKLEAKE